MNFADLLESIRYDILYILYSSHTNNERVWCLPGPLTLPHAQWEKGGYMLISGTTEGITYLGVISQTSKERVIEGIAQICGMDIPAWIYLTQDGNFEWGEVKVS